MIPQQMVYYPPPAFYPSLPSTPATTTTTIPSLFGTPATQQTQSKQASVTSSPFGTLPSFKELPLSGLYKDKPAAAATPTHYKLYPSRPSIGTKSRTPISAGNRLNLIEEPMTNSSDFFVSRSNIKKLEIKVEENEDDHHTQRLDHFFANSFQPNNTGQSEDILQDKQVPKLIRPGYSMSPSASVLTSFSADQLTKVDNFTVRRAGFGFVEFLKPVDIAYLNLDKIVIFERGEIVLYPKPVFHQKPGTGLNQPARVTLHQIFPRDKGSDIKKFESKLKRSLKKNAKEQPARHISYDSESGDWVFEVEHFSRFGIIDDDDDSLTEGEEEEEPEEEEEEEEEEIVPQQNLEDEDIIEEYAIEEDQPPAFYISDEDDSSDSYEASQFSEYNTRLPAQLGLNPTKIQV